MKPRRTGWKVVGVRPDGKEYLVGCFKTERGAAGAAELLIAKWKALTFRIEQEA